MVIISNRTINVWTTANETKEKKVELIQFFTPSQICTLMEYLCWYFVWNRQFLRSWRKMSILMQWMILRIQNQVKTKPNPTNRYQSFEVLNIKCWQLTSSSSKRKKSWFYPHITHSKKYARALCEYSFFSLFSTATRTRVLIDECHEFSCIQTNWIMSYFIFFFQHLPVTIYSCFIYANTTRSCLKCNTKLFELQNILHGSEIFARVWLGKKTSRKRIIERVIIKIWREKKERNKWWLECKNWCALCNVHISH